jgi:predicted nuclease of predicted toxin-antitoxin system
VDAVSLRDRSLLQVADHTVLKFAQDEKRAVATINEADFEKLASRKQKHYGIATIPSGKSRDEQYEMLAIIAAHLRAANGENPMAAIQDNIVSIDDTLQISSRRARAEPVPVTVLRSAAGIKPAG